MLRIVLASLLLITSAEASSHRSTDVTVEKFRQLEEILPTPNMYRNASGAPGPMYWQQKVDYRIAATLDDENQTLTASANITYTNNAPDSLRYLWVQLDQNRFRADSISRLTTTVRDKDRLSFAGARLEYEADFGGGFNITAVKDTRGGDLPFTIVGTMMRVDLPDELRPQRRFQFSIEWNFKIVDATVQRSRSGYEYFEEDENYLYTMAQWFPRLAAYTDVSGWNNKQFLGSGEFTLEFGDYDVAITVPKDHVVSATGSLQNPWEVLSPQQRARLAAAEDAEAPVLIVTPEEAEENEKSRSEETATWQFRARNVRDFAFATSRKFIWDAQGHTQADGSKVMAMSFYPKEGNPLWEKYSTEAIIHTLNVYNRYTFNYPYPLAQSVNGPIGGMEYPMISFNGPRPEKDDDGNITYSRATKYALISVIIHEIGHNYFPMIVNSDERQWTWMDEGLNTFLQFLAEQEWEEDYPSRRGEPRNIVDFMKSPRQVPIMTHSDSVLNLGNNAYAKPATALVVLRETVLGRELFDFAFREYAQRWQFKRPTPADFFRTMEDASGTDLDWFWRGWFYSTDPVDIAIDGITRYTVDTQDPDIEEPRKRDEKNEEPLSLTQQRNEGITRRLDERPALADFYNENDPFTVTEKDRKKYQKMLDDLEDWEKDLLAKSDNFYMVDLSNKGGLVMPVILGIYYSDGSEEEVRLPAELWRMDAENVTKLLVRDKFIDQIVVDPHLETADVDIENNYWPRRIMKSRLELFKRERFGPSRNLMKDMLVSEDDADSDKSEEQDADAPETEASIDGDGSDILDGPLNEDALNDQQPNAAGRAANEGEPAAPDAPSFQN